MAGQVRSAFFKKGLPFAIKLRGEGFFWANQWLLMIIILDIFSSIWLYVHITPTKVKNFYLAIHDF